MAFPSEFRYTNEDDFTERLLIPLLQQLGFSLVFNYHGASEFGKDLIFAEIDRFGHIRYHGLQAKYESSISLNEVERLISDCLQAFANPFTHPQTGTKEQISTFYAVTGGSIGDQALNHYFNSLRPKFSGNVRLLQGKDLVSLARWASVTRVNSVGEIISGLLIELRFNRETLHAHICETLEKRSHVPLERFRLNATSAYLSKPALAGTVNNDDISNYWSLCSNCNSILDALTMARTETNRDELTTTILTRVRPNVDILTSRIEAALSSSLASLAPLVPM